MLFTKRKTKSMKRTTFKNVIIHIILQHL